MPSSADISKLIADADENEGDSDVRFSTVGEYNKSVFAASVNGYKDMMMLSLVPKDPYPSDDSIFEMKDVIENLMCHPKGIFLYDDEPRAIGLILASLDLMNTIKNRKTMYSAFLDAMEPTHISGVILSEEILDYSVEPSVSLLDTLSSKGVLFGVRVDKGVGPLSGKYRDECRTDGLDQLVQRLSSYKKVGCKFAKWRSVFRISDTTPSHLALSVNCNAIGKFSAITQSLSLVPIIEIELISFKTSFIIEQSAKILEKVLIAVVKTLSDFNISIETTIIQTSMPHCTIGCRTGKITTKYLAQTFLNCLKRSLPTATGGVSILSGNMSEDLASVTFSTLMYIKDKYSPWPITFAFGKALTHSAIQVWDQEACKDAQDQFRKRVAANALARTGRYKSGAAVTVAMHDDLPMDELVH
ncbi:unnamed protein product [Nezara viridula]|uniref:fructose-bisphosphate aldolase n=1 Tax=Nezara viridula TaxID=85310 RepID=A0A9P0E716_NEZVI|nr:unnamed protein product [Nezara viridula]